MKVPGYWRPLRVGGDMRILNHWEQVLGRTIHNAEVNRSGGYVSIEFNDGSVLYLESADPLYPYSIDFYSSDSMLEDKRRVKPSSLKGRTINRIVVPFLAQGVRDEAFIAISFADGGGVIVAAEDWFVGMRIT